MIPFEVFTVEDEAIQFLVPFVRPMPEDEEE
jgi:hypothetical protein